jgi:[ribosomal protein S5]-alanine N-acetyltransferase
MMRLPPRHAPPVTKAIAQRRMTRPADMNSQRISLRPFEASDLDELQAVMGHPDVMRFSLSGPKTKTETEDFIKRCRTQYDEFGYGLLAVVYKDENRVIGYCGLFRQEIDGVMELEIGYRLHPNYWRRGIATEAAMMIRDWAFANLGREKLISIIEPENAASIAVAKKIGMNFEREFRFKGQRLTHIYSLRKTQDLN